MKIQQFFRPIFKEAWLLTKTHKGWWFVGLFALFLIGAISFQAIYQGVRSLTAPDQLLGAWEEWSILSDPIGLFQGQLQVLQSAPKDFFILALVWVGIGLVVLAAFSLSVFAVTMILSAAKHYMITQRFSVSEAIRESIIHFWGVFWAFLFSIILINVLVIVFSLPVISLGLTEPGAGNIIALIFLFSLFLFASFLLSVMGVFTACGIVLDDYTLSQSIQAAWGIFKRHLVITIEMFFLHISIAVLLSLLLVTAISLTVVPVAIIGVLFIAAEQFLVTQFLPVVMIVLLYLGVLFIGAVYTMFQLVSWAFFYKRIDDIKPYSRIASYTEITFKLR